MKVETTHRIDAGRRDAQGRYQYYYEYDLYEFSDGAVKLLARSYVEEPDEVHFLNIGDGTTQRMLTDADLRLPLAQSAARHLAEFGKKRINWLSERGYEPFSVQE